MNNLITKNIKTQLSQDELIEYIKEIISGFCKEKMINESKQNYMISFSNENSFKNDAWYSLCSNDYFNFYGKYYYEDCFGIDIFKNKKELYELEISPGLLIICMHHFYNKTISNNAKFLEFYVAPLAFIRNFEPGSWVEL